MVIEVKKAMAHIYFCNNPRERCTIGDCVIRALSKALNKSWDDVYIDLASEGFFIKDMPSSNEVWGSYLYSKGFNKHSIPGRYSYTIEDFCMDHPYGVFVVGTGSHAVAVIQGNAYDTWNSSQEEVAFYWEREEM